MLKYLKYLIYVLEHKKNVLIECWKDGLYLHGITHDLSKFRPSEFIPYAKYFYGSEKNKKEFEEAWELHYRRNKHHWNHWTYYSWSKTGSFKPVQRLYAWEMPEKYIKQMICDWKGMSRKFGDTWQEYYYKNKDNFILHETTIKRIEKIADEAKRSFNFV